MNQRSIEDVAQELLRNVTSQYGSDFDIHAQVSEGPDNLAIIILQGRISQLLGAPGVAPSFEPAAGIEIGTVEIAKDLQPYAANTTFAVNRLMDVRGASVVLMFVDSSCNQPLTIQTIGHLDNQPADENGRVDLGVTIAIGDGSTVVQRSSISIERVTFPHPWIGVTIASGGTPPTTGVVNILGYFERAPNRVLGAA